MGVVIGEEGDEGGENGDEAEGDEAEEEEVRGEDERLLLGKKVGRGCPSVEDIMGLGGEAKGEEPF
jgi:hypothetical protein